MAATDTYSLYNPNMTSDASNGGITQSGSSGSYTYAVKAGFADNPVVYVSFYDALRFANWLNNGQGRAGTETGAYTLRGGTPTPSNGTSVTRNNGATIVLPSENEWYKAAYYNPGSAIYNPYPFADGFNSARCYPNSPSPSGTFDQGGNAMQWNEQIVNGVGWSFPGGWWGQTDMALAASGRRCRSRP